MEGEKGAALCLQLHSHWYQGFQLEINKSFGYLAIRMEVTSTDI